MTVIETPSFLRDAKRLMDEAERLEIISFLARNPDAGDIVRGTAAYAKFALRGKVAVKAVDIG